MAVEDRRVVRSSNLPNTANQIRRHLKGLLSDWIHIGPTQTQPVVAALDGINTPQIISHPPEQASSHTTLAHRAECVVRLEQDLQTRAKGQTDKAAVVPSPPSPKTRGQHKVAAAEKYSKTPAEAKPAATDKEPETPAEAKKGSYMIMSTHDQFMIWVYLS
ncbi:hypothetical protein H0H87_002701 [Tephrocybe sp. NHM501043]|nr:hypothetical protein H0H87_002701 [Tephrocybe sp. NHM501043]